MQDGGLLVLLVEEKCPLEKKKCHYRVLGQMDSTSVLSSVLILWKATNIPRLDFYRISNSVNYPGAGRQWEATEAGHELEEVKYVAPSLATMLVSAKETDLCREFILALVP